LVLSLVSSRLADLFNRHLYYYADPDGWNWLEYPLFLIPGGFYLALLIRWLRLVAVCH